MCNMTHAYVRHVIFISGPCLIHSGTCLIWIECVTWHIRMTHSYVMILLFITWLFRSGTCLMCIDWFMRVCCDSLIAGRVLFILNVREWHIRMTHSYVQHVSFICGPHSYVQHVSFICGPHSYVQLVSFICGPHSYVQLVSFICGACLVHNETCLM